MSSIFQRRIEYGQSISRAGLTVTPEAEALVVRLGPVAFTWSRPVAVHVAGNGTSERLAVVDVTRLVQIAITIAIPLTVAIVGRLSKS